MSERHATGPAVYINLTEIELNEQHPKLMRFPSLPFQVQLLLNRLLRLFI